MRRTIALTACALALIFVTSVAMAANTVAVEAPGLNGTGFALKVDLDGTATTAYVSSDHPNSETIYRARFWMDPRELEIPFGNGGTNNVRVFFFFDQGGGFQQHTIGFITRSAGDMQPHMIIWSKLDDNTYKQVGNIFLGAQPRQIEVQWAASTGAGNDDGMVTFARVDGNGGTGTRMNMDNDMIDVDRFRAGVMSNSGYLGGNQGAHDDFYWFDEFESFRTLSP